MMQRLIQRAVKKGLLQRLPEAVKAPFRPFIRPEQLYDVEVHKLGLSSINASDVFLCSFLKSGNTWLRFLTANLLCPAEVISFRNIDRYVPDIHLAPFDLERMTTRPVMKTHCPFLHRFPRTIYICRDPRDVYVSYFHYSLHRGWFRGDLKTFLRHENLYYGTWHDHVEAALAECEKRPGDVLFLKYEDMLAAPASGARSIAQFLGLDLPDAAIAEAVDMTSFTRLRENEKKYGGEQSHADRGFFRKGVKGGWKDELSPDDVALIVERHGKTMCRLGYC